MHKFRGFFSQKREKQFPSSKSLDFIETIRYL